MRWEGHGIPGAFRKQVVPAIHMDHTIFEDAFPLVLDTSDLAVAAL